MNAQITVEQVRELFRYDPTTGDLRWAYKTQQHKENQITGCPDRRGYKRTRVNKQLYLTHRLVWLWVHGAWPSECIDHINGDPSDNRITNLRSVTAAVNGENVRKAKSQNSVGLLGVRRTKRLSPFGATIMVRGKGIWLGSFATPEDAHAAYLSAKRRLHAGCTI